VTFYRSVDQLPDFEDYAMAHRTYRYFGGAPLYPFGYGLSYTRFRYADPHVSSAQVRADGSVTVSVDVANVGAMDGDEVVQLYASRPDVAGAPIRALAGFQRIHLARGQTRRVQFTLAGRDLSLVDPQGVRRTIPGTVDLWIGGGQPGGAAPGVPARFRITSAATLPN
jgi:beta-glucosidase